MPWDSFKLLDDFDAMPTRKACNLAKTLGHLIQKGWLSLAVIKVRKATRGTRIARIELMLMLTVCCSVGSCIEGCGCIAAGARQHLIPSHTA